VNALRYGAGLLLAGLLAGGVPAARAQESLYGAQAPRDSAYLRFANTLPADVTVRVDAQASRTLGTQPAQRIGAYTVIEAVEGREVVVTAEAGGRTTRAVLKLRSGSYVTALLQQGGDGAVALRSWTDNTEYNQLRARLSFYNAMPSCPRASLAIASNGSVVFPDVPMGAASVRGVNPVSTQLQATCAGQPDVPVALEGLEAGAMYSIWLMPDAKSAPAAFLTRDVVTPWRRPPGG
jgi:hypothetical protein